MRSSCSRPQLFADYLEGVLHHEVEGRRDRSELTRTYRYLAASTSRLLNVSNVANEMGSARDTVAARVASLEASFLVHLLPGHRPTEHRTLTAHPKIHVTDIGLGAWAARLGPDAPTHVFGSLVESFVVNELAAQASWSLEPVELRHWRDTTRKLEIDALALASDGRSVAFEIKAGPDVRPDDLRGLRHYLATVRGAERGVVYYTGSLTLQVDERIWAVPISSLWS